MKWSAFTSATESLSAAAHAFVNESKTCGRAIELSQRFHLPDVNHFLEGKKYTDFLDLFHLPFDSISILHHQSAEGIGTDVITVAIDVHSTTFDGLSSIYGVTPEGAWTLVLSTVRKPSTNIWVLRPAFFVLHCELANGSAGIATCFAEDEFTRSLVEVFNNDDAVHDEFRRDSDAVLCLCMMLGTRNVQPHCVPAPYRVNAKRARNRRMPLMDYHVLKVDGDIWSYDDAGQPTGRVCRSHLRRGHLRRMGDGHCIWVRAAYVRGQVAGFVSKDYEVDQ